MQPISIAQLTLLGIAAVGGLAAGTCLGVRRMLRNGQARAALLIGYAVIGLTSGVLVLAGGIALPLLDVSTLRGALLVGAAGGLGGVVLLAGANIGSTITLRYLGLRMTIEPDNGGDRHRQSNQGDP